MVEDGAVPAATEEYEAPRLENKRKFGETGGDEQAVNINGNSDAGESVAAASVAYNSVPPPLSEFELAKQKAAQIAARLVGSEVKRPRTEETEEDFTGSVRTNGLDLDPVFIDSKRELDQPLEEPRPVHHQLQQHQEFQHGSQQYHQGSQFYVQSGSNQSRKIDVPNSKVGLVIGKGGETIKYLQHQSGARIQVARDGESDPRSSTRQVELMGSPEQISRAEQLVKDVITEASTGGSGALSGRGFGGPCGPAGEQVQVKVPNNKVGLIIGRGGETIKNLQSRSGARIQVQNDSETEPGATERMVTIIGNKKATDMAYDLIKEVIDEQNRSSRGLPGSYNQQLGGGYRPSGPQQWGPPAAPPYGYQQPHYPGPPQQYQPPQAYGQFSQPPSGAYSSGWDQRSPVSAAQPQQQTSYDFYGQQVQHTPPDATTPTEAAGYAYNQQGYYQGFQQQPAQAASYGDQAASYGTQSYSQQAYGQPIYSGYSYAQPNQGDAQSFGQQGHTAYGQSQIAYTAITADISAPGNATMYNVAAVGSAPSVPVSQPAAVSAPHS